MEKKTFIKLYDTLLNYKEINLTQSIVLSLILSYHQNNLKVFMTNESFAEQLGNKVKFNTIKSIIPVLERNGFITIEYYKTKATENKWSNRRIITVTQKTIDIINSEFKEQNEKDYVLDSIIELGENEDIVTTEIDIDDTEDDDYIVSEEEKKINLVVEELKLVFRADEHFDKVILLCKMHAFDDDGYCFKKFEERFLKKKAELVKLNKPQPSA